jgi:excisionase family DNA binding protein
VSHVAHRLSRSVAYVRRLIRDGKLIAVWEGDEWRVSERELAAYVARCEQEAAKKMAKHTPRPGMQPFSPTRVGA